MNGSHICNLEPNWLIQNNDRNLSGNKNFKEDDVRRCSYSYKDLSDIRSEISDGRRIDLDEDTDNYFNIYNKSKFYCFY